MKAKTNSEVIAVLNRRMRDIFYSPIPGQQFTKSEQHEVECLKRAIAIVRASRKPKDNLLEELKEFGKSARKRRKHG